MAIQIIFIDATILGSVYDYTYTANPDGSGNTGDSVTRTIVVVDNTSSTSCMDPESSYNVITGDNSSTITGTAGMTSYMEQKEMT